MKDEQLDHLSAGIRDWARRPPTRSPKVARTRVLAGLVEPRRRLPWKLAATVAAFAVAVTTGLVLDSETPSESPEVVSPPAQKLLVYELSSGTQLYFALTSPAAPATDP